MRLVLLKNREKKYRIKNMVVSFFESKKYIMSGGQNTNPPSSTLTTLLDYLLNTDCSS